MRKSFFFLDKTILGYAENISKWNEETFSYKFRIFHYSTMNLRRCGKTFWFQMILTISPPTPHGRSIKVSNFYLKNLNFSLGVYYHYLSASLLSNTSRLNIIEKTRKQSLKQMAKRGKRQKKYPIRQRQFFTTPIWTIIFSLLQTIIAVFLCFLFDYFFLSFCRAISNIKKFLLCLFCKLFNSFSKKLLIFRWGSNNFSNKFNCNKKNSVAYSL